MTFVLHSTAGGLLKFKCAAQQGLSMHSVSWLMASLAPCSFMLSLPLGFWKLSRRLISPGPLLQAHNTGEICCHSNTAECDLYTVLLENSK